MKKPKTYQILKKLPKTEANILWGKSLTLLKEEQPESFSKTIYLTAIIGITGIAIISLLVYKNQEMINWEIWLSFCLTLFLVGIGAYYQSISLHKKVEPYMERIIQNQKNKD